MTRQDFLGLKDVFEYHLSAEEHEHFISEFLEEKERLLRPAS
jgi:hypothetical protein